MIRYPLHVIALVSTLALGACQAVSAADAVALPAPGIDTPKIAAADEQTAVFAGGCFWGIEGVFEHVKGVRHAVSGYAGGAADTAHYGMVGTGSTGHAESVQVTFDPSQVSYGQLLQVFFSVALDPTELNRQGPDRGSQYRSALFYRNDQQKQVANAYIAQLTRAHAFAAPIVTQVVPLQAFYPAEAYHQNFLERHPHNPYIVINDAPKVAHLQQLFPERYRPVQ